MRVRDVERDLALLAADAAFPPTPDIAGAVAARLHAAPPRQARLTRRSLAVVIAALVALPAGTVAAIEPAREEVLEFLGLRSASVRVAPELPPQRSGSAGATVSLDEARDRVPYAILLPRALGEPSRVQLNGERVTLTYGGGVRLTELEGGGLLDFVEKIVTQDASVRRVTVEGDPGIWIAGGRHFVFFRDAAGRIREQRTAGPTLLFERDGLVLRVEGIGDRDEAIRIASSLEE